ncbi:hypothetical protein [Haladaptatus sp. NG-SE-30]
MFGQTRRFWFGLALLLVGAALIFGSLLQGLGTPPILLAFGVLVLAVGTLVIAVARRTRPV